MAENKLAWSIYVEISSISCVDSNGIPTVTELDAYFKYTNLELTTDEFDSLFQKIIYINSYRRYLLGKKLEASMKRWQSKSK